MSERGALHRLVDEGRMAGDWAEALRTVDPGIDDVLADLWAFLLAEARAATNGCGHLPSPDGIFAAFVRPLADVRVLVVGQDPYPTPGHPIGLSFAVAPDVRPIPRSLANIYRELEADLGIAPAPHGDLSAWSEQGVMLLNRVLTVRPGVAGSHRRRGWERVTDAAIQALVRRGGPLVAVLWGRDARQLKSALGDVPSVESAHPSPLSASRGFFGSRPFSGVNALLVQQGVEPVNWQLE